MVMHDARIDTGKNVARGIAALFVCIDHAYGFFLYPYFGNDALATHFVGLAAHQAVMVFFAISGFLITKSILANIGRNASFSLRDYVYARVARVYPPLVFSVVLTYVLYSLVHGFDLVGHGAESPYRVGVFPEMRDTFTVTMKDMRRALKMQNGLLLANGPLWSLCIEWWIYIAVGLAVYVFSVRGVVRKMLWAGVLAWAVTKLYTVNSHAMFYLGIWLFGGSLAVVAGYRASWFVSRQLGVIGGLLVAIFLLAWMKPEWILAGGRFFGWGENAVQFVICAFWCALILPDQRSGTALGWRALFGLGECSYSLYILHFPLTLFMLSVFQSVFGDSLRVSLLAVPVVVILSVLVSYVSSLLLEDKNRFLRMIRMVETYVLSKLKMVWGR